MENDKTDDPKGAARYEKPEVNDYGDLAELTASHTPGNTWDIPKGTSSTVYTGSVFS